MKTNTRKPPHKCRTPYCRNDRPKDYTLCHKCRSRLYKKRHPMTYFWNALNNNAKAQGRVINFSKDEYAEMWKKHQRRGK